MSGVSRTGKVTERGKQTDHRVLVKLIPLRASASAIRVLTYCVTLNHSHKRGKKALAIERAAGAYSPSR